MTETIGEKLMRLWEEHPDLPIIQRVSGELERDPDGTFRGNLRGCDVTEYTQWGGYFGGYYVRGQEGLIRDEMRATLVADCFDYGCGVSEEALERKVECEINALDWKPCIVLEVDA